MGLHPATEITLKDGVSLEEFLYESITLRYPRKPIEPADEGKVSYSTMKNNKFIRDKYGTKIILSDNAKKAVSKPETPWHIPEHFTNPNAAMEYITKNIIPGLVFFPLTDGNYVGYLSAVDRSVSDVMYSADVEKSVGAEKVFLPAVYSISYGGTRMVKCMFFKELKPFKKINFSTDFNMANKIGYFYSPGTAATGMDFTPVNLVVRFATTEDVNLVEMTSVDDDAKK